MARFLDADPWNWTVQDVTHWFEHEATNAIARQFPHPDLPALPVLLQKLAENDVDGATLLISVADPNTIGLRFGIQSMGQQAKIWRCVTMLRSRSKGYQQMQDEPAGWETPRSTARQVHMDDSPSITANPPVPESVGGHFRSDETLVEDQHGRKRRKLTLAANKAEMQGTNTGKNTADAAARYRYLPSTKQPIDELVFGKVGLGKQMGHQRITHPSFVNEGDDDNNDNYQLFNTVVTPGMASYAYRQMRHLMTAREEVTIERKNQEAVVVYPYREGLQGSGCASLGRPSKHGRLTMQGTRSVLVIQAAEDSPPVEEDNDDYDDYDERYVATRENHTMVESNAIELGYTADEAAEMTGEFDHLLQTWVPQGDDLIPTDDDDEGEDEVTSTVTDIEDVDDLAEEDDQPIAEGLHVEEIIDKSIATTREQWQINELPSIEKKEAWKVWNQMKGSRTIRTYLVQGARKTIEDMETRLVKYKRDILLETWESENRLLEQCELLEPTVARREHLLWKISIWQSKSKPDHALRHRSSRAKKPGATSTDRTRDDLQNAIQALGAGDRVELSSSPDVLTAAEPVATETAMDIDPHSGEAFFAPEGSLVPQADDEPFMVPDDAEEADESHQSSSGAGSIIMPDADESDGYLPPGDDDSSGHSSYGGMQMRDIATQLVRPASSSSYRRPVTPIKQPNGADPALVTPNNGTPAAKSDPGSLPRLMLGVDPVGNAQVIDLVTDTSSSSPTPKKLAPKGLKRKLTPKRTQPSKPRARAARQMAEDARASDVDEWQYEELANDNLRLHMLIKLLRDMPQGFLTAAHHAFQMMFKVGVLKHLTTALRIIAGLQEESEATFKGLDFSQRDIIKECAWLASAWWTLRHDIVTSRILPARMLDTIKNKPTEVGELVLQFYDRARPLLIKRESQLFIGHKRTSANEPLELSSGLDTDHEEEDEKIPRSSQPGSAKKHKKVKIDQKAKRTRAAAEDRRQRFQDMQSQKSSNPTQLQAMIAADSSQSATLDINPMRDDDQPAIHISSKIAMAMKDYQIEGARFMWSELTADDDEDGSQGCLLAHTMGLGKTMQTIALMVAVDEASMSSLALVRQQLPKGLRTNKSERSDRRHLRILVLCPPSLLQNWRKEIAQWAPSNAFGRDTLTLLSVGGKENPSPACMDTLETWSVRGGVLLLSYSILRNLLKERTTQQMTDDWAIVHRIILKESSLVVADEAHYLKNKNAKTAIAATKFQTQSRVALTGTPMSNDVDEIYALISWVAPGFLGEPSEFSGRFAIPIKDGLYSDSSREERSRSLVKLKVLHREIAPKVNRANIQALKGSLKPKLEFVLTVELTEVQRVHYGNYVEALLGAGLEMINAGSTRIFSWLAVLQLLTNHPACYRAKLLAPPAKRIVKAKLNTNIIEDEANAVDTGDDADEAGDVDGHPRSPIPAGDEDVGNLGFSASMIQELLQDLEPDEDPALSAKARILLDIVSLSSACGDKLLVFSLSIPSLDYLGRLFRSKNISFGRIDGSMHMQSRNIVLQNFAANYYSLLLISTRAGGQGLNIQGANRVVIFDFGFNPAWEEQAVGRAYRLGQTKAVFVYRFVAGGTFETNIDNKQMFKTGLAQRVVDKKATIRNAKRDMLQYLYKPKDVMHRDVGQWIGKDPQVLDKILTQQLRRTSQGRESGADICEIRTMETLLDELDEPLTEQEKQLVEEEIAARTIGKGRKAMMTSDATALAMAAATMGDNIPSTAPAMAALRNRLSPTQAARAPAPLRMSSTQAMPGAATSPGFQAHPHAHGHGHGHGLVPRQSNLAAMDIRHNHTQGGRHGTRVMQNGATGSSPEFDGLPAPPSAPR